jgi:parvulin-like peptidyl-prolyl isomerase
MKKLTTEHGCFAHPDGRGSTRPLVLLVAGMVIGMALAAEGLLAGGSRSLPTGAVATVNDRPIANAAYERLVAGLATDKRGTLTEDDRRHVLDRLIDEELLIQRALELDLVRSDGRLRTQLAEAMIAGAVGQAGVGEPSRADLEQFFADNLHFFEGPALIHVRRVFVAAEPVRSADDAQDRARLAQRRLVAGEEFAAVRDELGDTAPTDLPDTPLAPSELRAYLGPTAARTMLELREGEVSQPLRSAAGLQVLQVVARAAPRVAKLGEIEGAVRAEWKRRAEDAALRRYLDDLRAGADVVLTPMS